MCGVTEVTLRSGRAASASRVPLGYEVRRRRHGGASVTLHSGVEVCCGHAACASPRFCIWHGCALFR